MSEILMVSFILINIVEVMRKVSSRRRRWSTIARATSNTLQEECWKFESKIHIDLMHYGAYWVTREWWTTDTFGADAVAALSRWCCREYPTRIVIAHVWTTTHHHLIRIRRATTPSGIQAAAAKAIAFLSWFFLIWHGLGRRWNWDFMQLIENTIWERIFQ